jgi:hypothetical protein
VARQRSLGQRERLLLAGIDGEEVQAAIGARDVREPLAVAESARRGFPSPARAVSRRSVGSDGGSELLGARATSPVATTAASAAPAPIARRRFRPRGTTFSSPRSARTTSPARAKRWRGSISRQRRMAVSQRRSSSGTWARGDGGGSLYRCTASANEVSPANGRRPVTSS